MNEDQRQRIFEAEYERERARDVYKSAKEAKSTKSKRRFDFVVDGIIAYVVIYCIFLWNNLSFGNVKIFDLNFFIFLIPIILINILGLFIFPKNH